MAGAQSLHANIYATQVCPAATGYCTFAVNWLVTVEQPVSKFATEKQNEQWLPPLISGQSRTCFGV